LGNFEVNMAPTWKFAEFELDPENQVLRKHGKVVKLAPQPYKVLLLLVSRSGGLVRRDELCQAIWGDGVNVDFEHGLNTSMRQVRAALGDDPDAPHIIETVPRVGYRLIVPVSQQVQRRPGRAVATATLIAASVAAVWVGIAYTARSGRITTPT
jgi:DNA-binding winged helix-turn-helix (wHTH) protein